jgi:Xaa-Pro aminopeptidase
MRYTPLSSSFYKNTRQRLFKLMEPGSVAILHSADIYPSSADGVRPFRQQTDLLYLSGIDQEESVLVLFPDAPDPKLREMLFVKETSEHIAIWEGEKLTKEQATKLSGVENVHWLSELPRLLNEAVFAADNIYLVTNEHLRASTEVQTRTDRAIEQYRQQYPLHQYKRLAPLLHQLRAIKQPEEIAALQEACNITEAAFRRILAFVRPGVWEFEIEAEIMHEFLRSRSRGFAYDPIIASGANACVLHYIANESQCKAGELILFDIGAEYANYAADLSRTIPVSGRFTDRQKAVYNAVLRVQKEAIKLLQPGNNITQYHKQVGELMEKELVDLGLLNAKEVAQQNPAQPLYKKYFMHGTSHHLGLDVHDYGSRHVPFEEGMVFTCEPGIYIREEGIGVRIENDVVITRNGTNDLMQNIPREAEEIEELMNA